MLQVLPTHSALAPTQEPATQTTEVQKLKEQRRQLRKPFSRSRHRSSPKVATANAGVQKFRPQLLTCEASEKVRKENYERIFDEARRKVRSWEQAHAK